MLPNADALGPAAVTASDSAESRPASEFLLRLCHDLRSCLRAIQPQAELLAKTGQSGPAEDFEKQLGFLLDGARRLDSILGGLAGYAVAMQIDAGSFRNCPLDGVLRNALMVLEKEHPGIGEKISRGALPRLAADPDRLQQVFELLLCNAIERSAGSQLHVEIGANPHQEGWLISLKDNGAAIDPASLDRAFQPLRPLNGRNSRDSGLALATCRVIVERHGGRIWGESDGQAGCAFYFTLPKAGDC